MQEVIFRASELMDMALQIERNGMRFYRHCAAADIDPEIKEIFEYLVEQEKEHLQLFSGMKEGLDDYSLPESYPGEMRSYVEGFVEGRVFSRPQEAQQPRLANANEAIDFAIQFEEYSILFYSTMKRLVRDSEQEVVERVIGEEHKHIRRLLELRRGLPE